MNFIRKTLMALGGVFILLVLVGGGYFYLKVQKISTVQLSETSVRVGVPSAESMQVIGTAVPTNSSATTDTAAGTPSAVDDVPAAGFTVKVSSLPASQQSVIRAMGFTDTITFTPAMIACAEGKLSVARVEEIRLGAAPSVLESASLLACI